MESQTYLSIASIIVFFSALGLYSVFQRRLEKQFLPAAERIEFKNTFSQSVGILAIFFFMAVSIISREVFGFAAGLSSVIKYSLLLVGLLLAFGYDFIKISRVDLPAEFVGKWHRLETAFTLTLILFAALALIWSFAIWQNEGYKIFSV